MFFLWLSFHAMTFAVTRVSDSLLPECTDVEMLQKVLHEVGGSSSQQKQDCLL